MRIPIRIQMTTGENGATALFMMLGYFGRFVSMEELREVCIASRNGSSPEQLKNAAEKYGLVCETKNLTIEELKEEKMPVIVRWKKRYYTIVKKIGKNNIHIIDPAKGEYKSPIDYFERNYSGEALIFTKGKDFVSGGHEESMFAIVKDRISPIIKPIIIMVILTLICIWLDTLLSKGMKYYMDSIVSYDGFLAENGSDFSDKQTIDQARDILAWFIMILLYMGTLFQLLFSIAKNRVVNQTSRKMSAQSNSRMIKKMLSLPLSFYEQYSAGELMGRLDSNEKLEQSIMNSLVPRTINTMMTIFYFFFLFSYNSTITIICLAIEVINFIITIRLQKKNSIISRVNATSSNEFNSSVLNGMNMIETIRSTGSEKDFFNAWYGSLMQVKDSQAGTMRMNRIISAVDSIHSFMIEAVRLFIGAYFISIGRITLGTMSLFMNIFNNLQSSLSSALSTMNTMQTMRTNIERVNDIMDRPSEDEIPLEEGVEYEKLSGRISVKDISYRYNKGDDPALDHVSLDVEPGQMIALVGGTGCGKSTLLKIMAGLYTAENGDVFYDGKKREEIPDAVFHSSIVTVDQEAVTFDDTVYNNIQMWDETIEDFEVILAARDAQIHDRITSDRQGYNVRIQENGLNFSGGEIQRLELARALAHEPTVLFLDEFTSALDALTEDKVIRSIREKGTTCVIVAHRLSTIIDCDRIYVMQKGKIVEQGTHDELYAKDGMYKKLVSSQ